MFTDELNVKLTELMDSIAEDDTRPEYARMRYPKLIPFMRFETKKYKVGDFGSVMIEKGNPSTPVMSKVLGKEGADRFFMEYVMPIEG